MPSHFDSMTRQFKCENPQCGKLFEETLRGLIKPDKIFCPACGTAIDISESKRTGEIGLDFNTASELDKLDKSKEK